MAVELPDDFDINQLDMADPATREFAKTLVDLDDPATKQWWDSTSPVRSAGSRFGDLVSKAAVSGPFGTMTVYAQDWMDSGKNLLKERFPGKSEEWYEDRTDRLLAENYKATVQEYEDKGKNDPYWKAEDSFLNNLGRAGLTIAGTVAGSGSPIDLAAPGASRVGKVAWQGALNAGEEVVNQAGQLGKDLRDSFSPGDVVMAGITGTALPALFETTGFVKDLFKGRGVDTTPGADPRMTDEVEEGLKDLYKTGTFEEIADYQIKHGFTTDLGELGEFVRQRDEGAAMSDVVTYLEKEAEAFKNRPQPEPTALEQEAAAFKGKTEPTPEDLFPTEESLAAKSKAMEEKLQAEATAFQNRNDPEPVEAKPVEAEAPKVVPDDVQAKIDQTDADIADLTKDWQNAPSYKTYENFDDLKGVDNDAIGAILDDGQVVINLSEIDTPETLKAVVFHEGLGHHGLTQKFGDDLDDILTNFYNNSTDFKAKVDAWIEANPGAYADSSNLVARAADEVLAKMSEKGPLPVAFVDKLKNMLKDFARKARLKGVEYSDREIRTILGMAHDAVIKGKPGGVRGNGFRYSKLKDEKELGTDDQFTYDDGRPPEQIKTYTTEEVRQKLFEKTGKRYMKSANDNIRPRASAPTPPRSGAGDEDWVEYHRKSAEFHQQKADHYQAKGKDRYAETARQQSASHLRSADRRSGLDTSKSGAAYHRQSADYYERAAKRYFDRGNAERGKFYQSMAAEARKLAKGYAEEALTARYMKKPTSPEFKKWFGDSKVVDKDGTPKVVYHGTAADITSFDASKLGSTTGAPSARVGFFFTDRPKTADYYAKMAEINSEYADLEHTYNEKIARLLGKTEKADEIGKTRRSAPNPNVLPVYLSLKNPLVHDFKGKVYRDESFRNLIDKAKAEGRDGVIFKGTFDAGEYSRLDAVMRGRLKSENVYVVFDPTQIKSAIGNNGSFDPTNPDIRYMKKPTVSRSEKSSNPDRFSLNMAETVAPKGETAKTFLKELEVYNNYELKNLSTDEAIKAAERLGIDKEWVKYFNDRRLGVQTPQPDMSRYLPKVKYMKSLSPEKMRTTNDVEDLLDFLAEENLKVKADPTTNAETIRQAEDMGLTVGKYLKTKGLDEQGVAARLKAAHQLITNQLDDLEGLRVRADKEQMSPSLYAQIKEKLAIVQAVYAKFDADAGETGRALQILKDISQSKKSASAAAKFMRDSEGVDITSDPEALIRLLNNMSAIRQVEGTEAAAKHFRKTREAKAEDYIGSVVYNFMLSSPKTWIVNALGSPFNFLNDLVVDGISSVAGQALRLSKNAERVYGREIAARIYGPIVAFQQYKTWKNIFDAFATGQGRSGSTLGKTGQRGLVMPGALTTIETPQRIMAGIDEFWANFLQMSNLYGEAAHESAKAGLKGKAFWADAAEKVENPTEELLASASKKTNKQLFRDTPSKWGQKIIDAQTPRYEDTVEIKMVQDPDTGKMRPTAKTTRPKSSAPERVGKFVAKTVVPFVPTLDSIARTLVRNSGPVALFSKEIRKDLMTKGVTRQSAIARISLSSAVLAFWAAKAAQGELTGAGDPNYKKQQSLGAVRPPLSIKVGDEWVSYAGLDPIAGQMAAAATAVEMSKGGGVISKETGMGMIIGMATALKNSSYAESLSNAMNMAVEGVKGVTGVKTGMTATANFAGSQAANLLTPAFVRWINQKFVDPAARDTTGDDSFGGRVMGRAISGAPGLSDNLPQKYDVYGRPMTNLRQPRYVETDPTVLELNRLEASTDKVLIGPVGPTVDIGDEKDVRLPSRIYQEYQKLAGEYILSDLKAEIEQPGWNDYTDEEKIEIIKETATNARKDARAELFGELEEGELDDTENGG